MKTLSVNTLLLLGAASTIAVGAGGNDLPEAYIEFGLMAEELVAPLVPLMDDSRSNFPLTGVPSDHGAMADELEAFTRPGLLLAQWLQMDALPASRREHHFTREEVSGWYRQALLNGTDPEHPAYWGHLLNYHQHGVEMSILTMSLAIAPEWLWEPLSSEEKDQVAAWLGEIRGNARYWNNHLYFAILTIEFLRSVGYDEPGDQEAIDFMFQLLEGMHVEGGWFKDGTNESYDHYNAYAFHTYGLWWSWKFGHTNPARVGRWRAWTQEFIPDYAHFFSASGEHLPYGRSITYRFNSLGVFGLAPQVDLEAIPYGEMRRICRKNLTFFLSQPITQEQGCLSVGWTDQYQGVAEPYTCPGSPYWAAKGLFMLAIPPDHPFWTAPEEPYPAERGDFTRVIEAPRFVLKGIDGAVELLNAGSQVSRSGSRYGTWKWSKLAYRTGLGFLLTPDFDLYPLDAQLTAVPQGFRKRFGRRATIPIAAEPDHLAFIYALGQRDDGVNFNAPIRTDLFPNGEWVLAVHRVKTFVPTQFFHGSFAIGSDRAVFEKTAGDPGYALAGDGERYSAIQNLAGFKKVSWDERVDDASPRTHLTAEYHVTPVLASETIDGRQVLAVLFWAGQEPEKGKPWEVQQAVKGHWQLKHPVLGKWDIADPTLPALSKP
jgi:hypothetical protein